MSFDTLGAKWGGSNGGDAGGTVYWSVEGFDQLNNEDGDFSEEDYIEALEDAFQAWEDVADIDFERAGPGDEVDIAVSADPVDGEFGILGFMDPIDVDPPSGGEYAQFVFVEIVFDEDEFWIPSGEEDFGSEINFFEVALHEIGHALGLDHVEDLTEIMNTRYENGGADELGDGDILGAQVLYGDEEGNTVEDPRESESDSGGGDGGGDGDGGSSGLIGLLLALLLLPFSGAFGGGGGGATGVGFGQTLHPEDEEDPDHDHDHDWMNEEDPILTDVAPTTDLVRHDYRIKLGDEDPDHDHDDHDHRDDHDYHDDHDDDHDYDWAGDDEDTLLSDLIPTIEIHEDEYKIKLGDEDPDHDHDHDLLAELM